MHVPFILIDPDKQRTVFAGKESESLLAKLLELRTESPDRLINFKFSEKDSPIGSIEGGTVEQITEFIILLTLQDEPDEKAETEYMRRLLMTYATNLEVFEFLCASQKEEPWYVEIVKRQNAGT
jgi:hypothetical protein